MQFDDGVDVGIFSTYGYFNFFFNRWKMNLDFESVPGLFGVYNDSSPAAIAAITAKTNVRFMMARIRRAPGINTVRTSITF